MNLRQFDDFLLAALKEDMPFGDISSEAVFDKIHTSTARLLAKADGVLCGLGLFLRIFELLEDGKKGWEVVNFADGDNVNKGDVICTFSASTLALLAGERTALNILQHLSGIATQTAQAVAAVSGTNVTITETRKTLPGLRALQKYAVRTGGGKNHRYSLSDAVMLKDNHIDAAGGIAQAMAKVRASVGHMVKIEVETRNLEEVHQALEAGADVIMLDNMQLDEMRKAVKLAQPKNDAPISTPGNPNFGWVKTVQPQTKRAVLEASGGIILENIRDYAETGVDAISLGVLTHSVTALDISMQITYNNL